MNMKVKYLIPLLAALSLGGCRPPDIVHHTLPVAPDVAIYSGGLYFQSKDGLRNYERVAIVPRLLTETVKVVFPDDAKFDAVELSADEIQKHGVKFNVKRDNGKGDFDMIASHALHAYFRNHRVERIETSPEYNNPGLISINFRDKHIVVPIKREELEKILGKPDEIKLKTAPPDR